MPTAKWSSADSVRAKQIWSDYERCNDVSGLTGQTAGIDPASGRIWFGDSIQDVVAQRDAEGISEPLFVIRVGSATYYRKGA